VLVRLAYMAELPNPADLARELHGGGAGAQPSAPSQPSANGGGTTAASHPLPNPSPAQAGEGLSGAGGMQNSPSPLRGGGVGEGGDGQPSRAQAALRAEPVHDLTPIPAPDPQASPQPGPRNFAELVALFEEKREAILHTQLRHNVHLVRFEPGRLEIRPDENAPRDLSARVGTLLSDWTGRRWVVSISGEQGEPTLAGQAEAARRKEHEAAAQHPLVQAARKAFPAAKITRVEPTIRAGLETDAPMPAPDELEPDDAGEE